MAAEVTEKHGAVIYRLVLPPAGGLLFIFPPAVSRQVHHYRSLAGPAMSASRMAALAMTTTDNILSEILLHKVREISHTRRGAGAVFYAT
jgi:hypothetical protein